MRAVLAAFALVLALPAASASAAGPDEVCDLHFSGGAILPAVPVAKTVAAQATGLANRDDAGPGLLFSWPKAEPRVFWMRDTHFPLTVGFFGADGVLFAQANMQPMTDTYHFSVSPAADALELAQGQFERHGLRIGSRIVSRECRPAGP
ncbi:DUF192 domain-containing protein [Mesorhizobium sp. J428]|uniref:DUF192 domain-containing protein n=1 Tax=Mesorhizobium sp. J428 TaxID=2898440 RepID=UPI0021510155|nr:DUF192 domain-containing protein [Mesorhizobium sp. J428]MCR5860130.1 DUF192 domain-containing protein [Mesorhizobium sp. J428]MCR5860194.1 DUF192 domain-containing protein [Mesorhizobium sp. J428]MCR5860223.1 DUF192 domain-containing protein [Mesorhizobium sp. J428]